jgi:hypothetical protein
MVLSISPPGFAAQVQDEMKKKMKGATGFGLWT